MRYLEKILGIALLLRSSDRDEGITEMDVMEEVTRKDLGDRIQQKPKMYQPQ